MTAETYWLEEGTVLYSRFSGTLTMEDIIENHHEFVDFARDSQGRIYSIIDIADLESFPTRLKDFGELNKLFKQDSNSSMMIIIGASAMAHFLINIISQVTHIQCHTVDNIEDAHSLIERLRLTR